MTSGSGKKRRRGRPPAPEAERKDRLVQTRVDEDLDEALREAARRQRTTVSQLIRNVLHDTFQLVDDIVANTATLTDSVRRDAQRIAASATGLKRTVVPAKPAAVPVVAPAVAPASDLAAIDAWQEVTLNKDRACASCARAMAKGTRGYMGIPEDPAAPRPWLCPDCQAAL